MSKSINILGFIALAGAVIFLAMQIAVVPNNAEGQFFAVPSIGVATTSTAISVTTSARVLATTTSIIAPSYTRVYATVCNPSSNPVAISINGDRAVTNTSKTFWIGAAAGYEVCYEIVYNKNPYMGSITASSTNETATLVYVTDYVN
jgi:hypothetical protein